MHYKIGTQILIKTENAAKPESQSSSYLVDRLTRLPRVASSFDYGCGKLRYYRVLLDTTDWLAMVDSEVQLSRRQKIGADYRSIREHLRGSNRSAVFNPAEFSDLRGQFDRGFCINVLSAIPYYVVRERVLESIRAKLRRRASCLFVVQYRNSDFSRMRGMPNARPWRDGFLVSSLRGFSFYGLIAPDRLYTSVRAAGFKIEHLELNEGSAYLWATRF